MTRANIIAALRRNKAELQNLGIERLSLFGSLARNEASDASDVDIAILLTPGPRGLAHLERMDRIKARISRILGGEVDVVEEPAPSSRVQRAIERDRVLAF